PGRSLRRRRRRRPPCGEHAAALSARHGCVSGRGCKKARRMRDPECGASSNRTDQPAPVPSRRSLRGLDWFVFLIADVQTGFGPFISVYLTTQKWTQTDIGLALTIGSLSALLLQIPGGALVDFARSERFVAALAVTAISASALMLAAWP